ncbi:ABC transporter ATP-binding protein [uncultured Kocuria sp.]|uniref:ABC transporter ATP-binding protein n=1 Tax=uncultured Kocuria sp. TaxID=259305 RepID=UPI002598FA8A|nr:ABC transporter ATP-binding protein [uncultured Kocuria sp.]MCT1368247.1 ABC transporter ATP-binding protein [Rothia sp. p3-SID1597]
MTTSPDHTEQGSEGEDPTSDTNQQATTAEPPAWSAPDERQQPHLPTFGSSTTSSATTGHEAIAIRGLTRVFGDRAVVQNINLDIPSGSMYGLVGRNGAGKTTTLSMATGLLRPTHGQVFIRGIDVWDRPQEAKSLVGVLPDGVHLFDRLTGRQLITYAGLLHGLDKETVAERTDDLLNAMDLQGSANQTVTDYSAGMKKKVALAAAMVHAPKVLVLDEPFESVDPVSATNIRDILAGFVRHGGTVVVSSHVMDLVQRMCDHVAIMNDGVILSEGTVDQVRGESSLEETFVRLVGGRVESEGISWLGTS